jgi:hypothetical protein
MLMLINFTATSYRCTHAYHYLCVILMTVVVNIPTAITLWGYSCVYLDM